MRRLVATLTGLIAALAGLMVGPALAAASPGASSCLPGFVATGATHPCAPTRLDAAPAQPQLFGGLIGDAIHTALSTVVSWVNDSAADALRATVSLIGATTEPALQSSWFSATYWRVAALSALLTIPFLCAATVQAILRSDLSLLGRAAFGYLPLAFLGVAIAAPLTTLVLQATDEMCGFVSAAGGDAAASFLTRAAADITTGSLIGSDPFLAFFAGLLTVAATLALWVELLIRDAAVDVIMLMLPLFFAAMVWPARRVWAVRALETLVALILAKFGIIAVLTLGGSALDAAGHSPATLITGATLLLLATFTPWALLRLLPLHEVAAAAAGSFTQGPRRMVGDEVRHQRAKLSDSRRHAETPESDASGLGPDGVVSIARQLSGGAPSSVAHRGDGTAESVDAETAAGVAAVASVGSRPGSARSGDSAPAGDGRTDGPGAGLAVSAVHSGPIGSNRSTPAGGSGGFDGSDGSDGSGGGPGDLRPPLGDVFADLGTSEIAFVIDEPPDGTWQPEPGSPEDGDASGLPRLSGGEPRPDLPGDAPGGSSSPDEPGP